MSRTAAVRSAGDLGRALQEARQSAGLTQEQVAERTAVDRSYLARMDSGLSVLLLQRTLRVLRRLGAELVVVLPDGPPADTADEG